MSRITIGDLDRRVRQLNAVLGQPTTAIANGEWQIGHYHISGAYGGVCLDRVTSLSGGVASVSQIGYVSRRELYDFIGGMMAGIEAKRNACKPINKDHTLQIRRRKRAEKKARAEQYGTRDV